MENREEFVEEYRNVIFIVQITFAEFGQRDLHKFEVAFEQWPRKQNYSSPSGPFSRTSSRISFSVKFAADEFQSLSAGTTGYTAESLPPLYHGWQNFSQGQVTRRTFPTRMNHQRAASGVTTSRSRRGNCLSGGPSKGTNKDE
jgi:hypothetical protein